MPLALVPLPWPRPARLLVAAFVPRLFSAELGREVDEVEGAFFEDFLADAGLSKNDVSVVLSVAVSWVSRFL